MRALVVGLSYAAALAAQSPKNLMEITKPSDRTIVIAKEFEARRDRVFDALTKPEHVMRWLKPETFSLKSYESELKAGGVFRYVYQRPGGKKIEVRGVYTQFEPPARLAHSESYDFSPLQIQVTIVLDQVRDKTVLTQTVLYSSQKERDEDYEGVASSSAELYPKLERYLSGSP